MLLAAACFYRKHYAEANTIVLCLSFNEKFEATARLFNYFLILVRPVYKGFRGTTAYYKHLNLARVCLCF